MTKHKPFRNLPCRNCLCVPRCSQKDYTQLFRECSKLSKYVKNYLDMKRVSVFKLYYLHQVLKPKMWEIKNNRLCSYEEFGTYEWKL